MKKLGFIFLFISILSLLLLFVARLVIGGWEDFLIVPLISFLLFFGLSIGLNLKVYIGLLTLKTSRHGFSLGVLVFGVLILLSSVNYMAVKSQWSWDLTSEKLYTLSKESKSIVQKNKSQIFAKILYKNDFDLEKVKEISDQLGLYKKSGLNVKVEKINLLKRPEYIESYLKTLSSRQQSIFLFFETENNKIQVTHPFLEEQITQGVIKLNTKPSKVYVLQDHQEWSLDTEPTDPFGLNIFKNVLNEFSIDVVPYSLNKSGPPEKESVILSIGPKSYFTDKELNLLEKHLKQGGKFIVAMDPGLPNNLGPLLKKANLEFKNNFIKDPMSKLGKVMLLADRYEKGHPIVQPLEGRNNIFNLASEVEVISKHNQEVRSIPLVYSAKSSFVVSRLSDRGDGVETKPYSLAAISEGRFQKKEAQFKLVVFGDSDFLRNELIQALANRELIINVVTYMLGESELLNLPIKYPSLGLIKPTTVTYLVLIIGSIFIPLISLLMAFFIWIINRRQGSNKS